MAPHFCIGHVVDMRLMDLYLFLMHMDALLWFYYVSLFIMLWDANVYVMYYYNVCVFLDMIMHYVMVVCFLYTAMDVTI